LIAPRAAAGTETLESVLGVLAHHRDPQTQQDFKQIPPYLRDLLHKVSNDFTAIPGHYVKLAHLLLKDFDSNVLFIVLNYDDLLERALTLLYPEFLFREISDYVSDARPFQVVKLHGSINWFAKLSGYERDDWNALVNAHDIWGIFVPGVPFVDALAVFVPQHLADFLGVVRPELLPAIVAVQVPPERHVVPLGQGESLVHDVLNVPFFDYVGAHRFSPFVQSVPFIHHSILVSHDVN